MKVIHVMLISTGILLSSSFSSGETPSLQTQPKGLIADAQIHEVKLTLIEYAKSANFHSGDGDMIFTVRQVQALYRDTIASGKYATLSFEKPYPLTIVGNRSLKRDMLIDEIVVGFSNEFFPTQPFLVLSDGRLLVTNKCRGDLALKLSHLLTKSTKDE